MGAAWQAITRYASGTGTLLDVLRALDNGTGVAGPPPPPPPVNAPYTCSVAVGVRDLVFLSAPDTVTRARSTTIATAPAIGMVVSKPAPTVCNVIYDGEVSGFVGLTPGQIYYLGVLPGQVTLFPALGSGNVLQKVGWARNSTTLVFAVDLDYIVID